MIVKFKKVHKDAKTPSQAVEGDACWDLTAVAKDDSNADLYTEYKTGLAIEVPEDHVGLLFPRSSVTKKDMLFKNCVGIIDPGYRGEITLRFLGLGLENHYEVGERIGQIMIIPRPFIDWQETETLSNTTRGTGGYGSSGTH